MKKADFKKEIEEVRVLLKCGPVEQALKKLREIEQLLGDPEDSYQYSRLYSLFSGAFYYLGEYKISMKYAERALCANHGQHGDIQLFGKIRHLQGANMHRAGRLEEAVEYLQEGLLAFRVSGDVRGQIMARNCLAMIVIDRGDLFRAAVLLKDLTDNISRFEYPDLYMSSMQNRLLVKNRLGFFSQVVSGVDDLFDQYRVRVRLEAAMLSERAFALAHLGRLEESNDDLGKAYAIATINNFNRETILFNQYYGLLKIISGEYDKAESSLRRAIELVPSVAKRADTIPESYRLLAELDIARSNFLKAYDSSQKSLEVSEEAGEKNEIGASYRCLAESCCGLNRPEQAVESYRKALEVYSESPHGYEVAKTRLSAAESGLFNEVESTSYQALATSYFVTENVPVTRYSASVLDHDK